jgi:hypothetical protein
MRTVCLIASLLLVTTASSAAPLSDVRVDVIEDAPLEDVLRRLQERHGLDYVVSDTLLAEADNVRVRLTDVPLDVALRAICAACGLDLEIYDTVLVILPRGLQPRSEQPQRPPALPVVPARPNQDRPSRRSPAQPLEEDLLQALGDVVEVDLENARLRLSEAGLLRDFYVPGPEEDGAGRRSSRLRTALTRLTEGNRVALQYRQEGTRAVIWDLVGGTRVQEPLHPLMRQPRRAQSDQEAPDTPPAPAPGADPLPGPQPTEGGEPSPAGQPVLPEGTVRGRLTAVDGDRVDITDGDGNVISCYVPSPDPTRPERRARTQRSIQDLEVGANLILVYEAEDGRRIITGLIHDDR